MYRENISFKLNVAAACYLQYKENSALMSLQFVKWSSVFKGTSKLNKAQRAIETKISNKRTRTR